MTVKLKWRSEDLTFVGCRERVAFELETNFGTSSNRHKLTHYTIIDSTFPAWYRDIAQEPQEATFGIGGAEKLVANKWYTIKFRFFGRLGPNEFISTTAARGYRYRSCVGAYAVCVNGWYQPEKFGPARLAILDRKPIAPGRTASWNYPARATLRNKILRNPNTRKAYTVDTSDVRHSIHDGGTYNCLTAKGWKVVNSFADIDQQWVIDSFKQGSDATCASVGSGDAGPGGGPGAAPPPAVGLAQGPAAPQGYRYAITLSGFAANTSVSVSCRDSVDPGGFYTFGLGTDGGGNASTASYCYSGDGPDHWVVAGGVESNHVTWGGGTPPPPPPPMTWAEQETPNHPVNTFTNYHNASGMGPPIGAGQWVDVSCKVYDPFIASVNPDGYWYRIASAPWNNAYYSPANTFMNGDPYGGPYTHNTDFAVANC
jgi:hypothetical protein